MTRALLLDPTGGFVHRPSLYGHWSVIHLGRLHSCLWRQNSKQMHTLRNLTAVKFFLFRWYFDLHKRIQNRCHQTRLLGSKYTKMLVCKRPRVPQIIAEKFWLVGRPLSVFTGRVGKALHDNVFFDAPVHTTSVHRPLTWAVNTGDKMTPVFTVREHG